MHPDFEFKKVPLSAFEDRYFSRGNLTLLTELGLPGFVSPHLYFGDFDDNEYFPLLKDWSWGVEWKGDLELAAKHFPQCYVIGSGQESQPIILMPHDSEVFQVSDTADSLILLNSDLESLYRSLDAFVFMIDSALTKDPQALIKQRIEPELLEQFKKDLESIDYRASLDDGLWRSIIEKCKLNFTVD